MQDTIPICLLNRVNAQGNLVITDCPFWTIVFWYGVSKISKRGVGGVGGGSGVVRVTV